ncbi:DUF1338 domain-containing protein [Litoribacillus peritrichatus]|uniref:2-oxoadipate dioxygenase/decarboxylase n=1 Tax=Litoribacillus peritrichatus TaxID=718191 RepID=A0ABP7N8H5_9GAMM
MSPETLFNSLWEQYIALNPAVAEIHQLFAEHEDQVINDHIALRTFQHEKVGISKVAKVFEELGYRRCGEYTFVEKKLSAVHLEHPEQPSLPKVFISELKLNECSEELQRIIQSEVINSIDPDLANSAEFCFSGRSWDNICYDTYEMLRQESEYAAWMYVYGYMANHFTVKVNALSRFESLEDVNAFVESHGFQLNQVGGVIKGSPEQCLEQSSTIAEKRPVTFIEGNREIPSCFYEFARRYPTENGIEFSGFIEGNADKIFESTNMK